MLNAPMIMYTRIATFVLTMLLIQSPLFGLAKNGERQNAETMSAIPRFSDPKSAATFGLEEIRKVGLLLDRDHEIYAQALGFSTASQTLVAELGVGLRTYDVPLRQLETFQAVDDPVSLLLDAHEIIFPVLVEGQPRSSLTIAEFEPGKGWRVLKKGRSTLIRLIEQYRTSNEDNLVVISAIGLRFLSKGNQTDQGELVLIPLADGPTIEIRAGEPILARQLFLELNGKMTPSQRGGQNQGLSIQR